MPDLQRGLLGHAVTEFVDHAHNLMAGDNGQLRQRDLALDNVQVGAAHGADTNP